MSKKLELLVPIEKLDIEEFQDLINDKVDEFSWEFQTTTGETVDIVFVKTDNYLKECSNRKTEATKCPIEEMMLYQSERGLDKLEYNPLNEASMVFEEILESLGYNLDKSNREVLKNKLLTFMNNLYVENIITELDKSEYTGHNRIDPHLDQIELNIGAIMKLDYAVSASILEMAKEIRSRKGEIINGKFEKFTKDDPRYEEPYKADYSKTKL
jgi:hypothetical protein